MPSSTLHQRSMRARANKKVGKVFRDILLPQHSRWRRLTLWGLRVLAPSFPLHLAENYAALEDVSIRGDLKSWKDGIIQVLVKAPQIRGLDLELGGSRNSFSDLAPLGDTLKHKVPWNQITTVRLVFDDHKCPFRQATEILALLQGCPRLEAIFMAMRYRGETAENRELYIGNSSEQQSVLFLDHVTLPKLKSISLSHSRDYYYYEPRANGALTRSFADFVRRSACEIEELICHRAAKEDVSPHPSDVVLSLLPVVSSTTTRLFIEVGKTEAHALLDGLTRPPTVQTEGQPNPIAFPRLRRLTLILWQGTRPSQAVSYPTRLNRLISSRWLVPAANGRDDGAIAPIQSIDVQIMLENRIIGYGQRIPVTDNDLLVREMAGGMQELGGQLELLSQSTGQTHRGIHLAVILPPQTLFTQSLGRTA